MIPSRLRPQPDPTAWQDADEKWAQAVRERNELLMVCKIVLPWVAIAMSGRDPRTTHPQAFKNHEDDLALLQHVIAKFKKD